MKITISSTDDNPSYEPIVSLEICGWKSNVSLANVHSGVSIKTDQGVFGIAQRDSGIEVLLDGKLIFSSNGVRQPTWCCDIPRLDVTCSVCGHHERILDDAIPFPTTQGDG